MDFPGRMAAGLIAAVLVLIFPLQYIAQTQGKDIDALVDDRTHRFTDEIRQKGYLDIHMYEKFINFLDTTGERYEIEIQDIRPVKGEDISYNFKTHKNTLVPVSYMNIHIFAHTHTSDCYNGTLHVHSGTPGLSYPNGCYTSKKETTTWTYCSSPCTTIDRNAPHNTRQTGYSEWTCSEGRSHVTVYYSCSCGATGFNIAGSSCHAISNFSHKYNYYSYCPGHTATTTVYELGCGKTEGKYYDSNGNEAGPSCDKVVVSITPTHQNQTVEKGGTIITSATATYLDGHTGTVNCTSNFNPDLEGNQTVTLTYTGLVKNAKTTGTLTCTINVYVKPNRTLTSLTVTPASQTVRKYKSPSFAVRANYSDNTYKTLSPDEYSITGFNPAKIGTQTVTVSYTENGATKSVLVTVTVTALQRECPRCQYVYDLNPDDTDPGCSQCQNLVAGIEVVPEYVEVTQGEQLPVKVVAIYNDGSKTAVNDWTSNFNPDRAGLQIVTVKYGGYAKEITVWVKEKFIKCPACNKDYPATETTCPYCAAKIVGISVDPNEITVMQYEPILLTVTAYFANGESRIVDEWSIDRDTSRPGTYIATVSYKDVSTTIKLNVLSVFSTQCPVCGLIYDTSESSKGCPVCSEELIGIEAYLSSGSNLVQLGTMPDIAIKLIFRDEHREFVYEGYSLDGFNPYVIGVQTIKVIYKEFFDTIVLEVVNALDTITCPNGHVYYRNEDGTDPGCPFCQTGSGLGKVIYFDITYTTEILSIVYSSGTYRFQEGNYISVIVLKRDKSLLNRIQRMFLGTSLLGRKRRFIYGGVIRLK